MPVRHLYLARHGEPGDDGRLTERGLQQAGLLGRRLAGVPLRSVRHGPLPRAEQTARRVVQELAPDVPVGVLAAAGDYVPHVPTPDDLDGLDGLAPEHRAALQDSLADVSPTEATEGAALAAEALRLLAGPEDGPDDGHHLVVTHAFTIGWLVAHACAAPAWRWWRLNHGHAALTVLRYAPDRPPSLVVFNDMTHLPDALRWTGFPERLRL
ncbi:histidine phosphatase family protein [Pimelobacter simplex]|uniref:histidine phosphatase family protein n=1 Tax=Nocardioides simplex TaxID=2045 RepID=UPI003AAA2C97